MLQSLRDKTSTWIAPVILILLVIPFAFFGVENYFQQNVATHVAKVGEKEIGQDEFRARFERRFTVERMAQDYLAIYRGLPGVRTDAARLRRQRGEKQMLRAVA